MARVNYHVVSLIDVNELLPFVKRESQTEEDEAREEEKLKRELHAFFETLKKNYPHPLHHIAEEKRFGKHMERYLIEGGGFIEIMVEAPLHLNAHFTAKAKAEEFAHALKQALHEAVPDSPVRQMFVDSISVKRQGSDTYHKYDRLHHHLVYQPIILLFTAINILLLFGVLKAGLDRLFIIFDWPSPSWGALELTALVAALLVSAAFTLIFNYTRRAVRGVLP